MTWAKITDTFNDDPVLLRLTRGIRLVYIEAIIWSCKHETDGRIPGHVLGRITDEPQPEQAAAQLVAAGLWTISADGFEITGFLTDQRSAEEIDKGRARGRERQERLRRHRIGDHEPCDPRYCTTARSGVSNAVTNGVTNGAPTRPDPTRAKARDGRGGGTADSADALPPTPSPSTKKPPPFTVTMGQE